uniref:Uncharacterized protein n=1 Tax=Arundo donax TaxID=35708 RepID=A0A0A9BP62_ARUDO
MMVIFGSGIATGKFAMGSNEALGSPSNFTDSSLKAETFDEAKAPKVIDDLAKLLGETPKTQDAASVSGVDNKRKRSMLTDEDTVVLTSMTYAVNNVA